MRRNIVLCGFMGCGKSTVGKLLSKITGIPFADLDEIIENNAGMRISEIFARFGEQHFRDLEYEAAKTLSEAPGVILSTGGGALVFDRNAAALKKSGDIVLLDLPLFVARERLKGDTTRPMLQKPDRDAAMKELFYKRLPRYKAAADVVVNAAQPPVDVCRDIISALSLSQKNEIDP